MFNTISILVPVYNEKKTIIKCLDRIISSDTMGLEKEMLGLAVILMVSQSPTNNANNKILV